MKEKPATWRKIFDTEIFEGALTQHKYPWHFHDAYTVIIIDSGSMQYVFRNKKVTVNKRQVFIINPIVAHYNRPLTNSGCTYRVMFLPVQLFNQGNGMNTITHFENSVCEEIYIRLGELFDALKSVIVQDDHNLVCREISQLLLENITSNILPVMPAERVEPALLYIQHHLDEKLTIGQLSAICNLSHSHFQRIFKRATGLTVNAYIQQRRMEFGRELLRKGVKPVFTSLESGFFDQSHFHKQFKKMYVLTPVTLAK